MRDWVLTSSIVRDSPYWTDIWPVTEPIFAAYAAKWGMAWEPHIVPRDDPSLTFFDTSPAPRGTGVVAAGIPGRRGMLDRFKGVVFLDADAVVMDFAYDLCREVSDNVPLAAAGNFNGAVVVSRSCDRTREFFDLVWEGREEWRHAQWLEQKAMMELVGFDGRYPGDNTPADYLGDTEWTKWWCQLSGRWNASPFHPQEVAPLIFHPGGVQPFEKRATMVRDAAVGLLPPGWGNYLPRI